MSAIRTTGITTETNRLTSSNRLVLLNQLLAHVTVQSLQAIGMTNNNIATISLAFVSYDTNLTTECSTNGIANITFNISAVMITMECLTITKVACYQTIICWHMENAQINFVLIGHLNTIMSSIYVIPFWIKCRSGCLRRFFGLKHTNN